MRVLEQDSGQRFAYARNDVGELLVRATQWQVVTTEPAIDERVAASNTEPHAELADAVDPQSNAEALVGNAWGNGLLLEQNGQPLAWIAEEL